MTLILSKYRYFFFFYFVLGTLIPNSHSFYIHILIYSTYSKLIYRVVVSSLSPHSKVLYDDIELYAGRECVCDEIRRRGAQESLEIESRGKSRQDV